MDFELETCRIRHPAQWGVFKIPPRLHTAIQEAQSSKLFALPNELLLEIFDHAAPDGQLFLALTCKRLLGVSSMLIIAIPSAPKHRIFCPGNCSAMLGLLHRMRRGKPKDNSSAVCCDCYRYRPKKKRFWKGLEKRYPTGSVGLPNEEFYESIISRWCQRGSYSYQCPECWCEERVKKYGHLVVK